MPLAVQKEREVGRWMPGKGLNPRWPKANLSAACSREMKKDQRCPEITRPDEESQQLNEPRMY